MRRRILCVLVAVTSLVGCDHATKHWAEAALRSSPPVQIVPGVVDLTYTENHDVAFNLLRWASPPVRDPLLLAVGVLAVLALLALLFRKRGLSALERAGYSLVLAGALGNVLDRAARGHVVDFIHVRHWPVFNVADVLIVCGLGLAFLGARRREHRLLPDRPTPRE